MNIIRWAQHIQTHVNFRALVQEIWCTQGKFCRFFQWLSRIKNRSRSCTNAAFSALLALDVTSQCRQRLDIVIKMAYLFALRALCWGLFTLSKMIWSEGTWGVYGDETEQSPCVNFGWWAWRQRLSDLPQVTWEVVYLGWIFSSKPSST